MLNDQDTIAAVATAKGNGALSIVRISGERTSRIIKAHFSSKKFNQEESHKAFYGLWNDEKGAPLDEVLILYYKKGRGFTGEEAAEIICHGGSVVTSMVLDSILDSGARLARPGEFTYRAVINEKIDLAQAENVLELINAKNKLRANQALKNIKGSFSEEVRKMESKLVTLLARLEADIDFSTEDIQPVNYREIISETEKIKKSLEQAVCYYELNKKYQQGISITIVGLPNAGKSSLLNVLSGRDRSIVSSLPGTTRDVVETELQIEGMKIRLLDTAGMRETSEEIEKIGVEKAISEARSADIVLYIIDISQGMSEQDKKNLLEIGKERAIICFNKEDLSDNKKFSSDVMSTEGFETIKISCINKTGIQELLNILSKKIEHNNDSETDFFIASQRQKELLESTKKFLLEGAALLKQEASPELVAFEYKSALLKLKDVLGEEYKDDILDKVFKEFCIGK